MPERAHPVIVGLSIQIATTLLVYLLILSQPPAALTLFEWSVIQGILAGAISYIMHMPVWWIPIHLAFIPLVIITLALNIPPTWFLLFFFCLLFIYGKIYKTQVPLYLSSKNVNHALESLLPGQGPFSFVDLGSGCGGLLNDLAGTRKNGTFHGIEYAPIPFLISRLRILFGASGCKIVWGDFWKHDFSKYDIVYAYLSPVPMTSLWQKARKEMRPGSLLISNTFIIPGIAPDKSIPLNDFSNSTLYLWRI